MLLLEFSKEDSVMEMMMSCSTHSYIPVRSPFFQFPADGLQNSNNIKKKQMPTTFMEEFLPEDQLKTRLSSCSDVR